MSVEKFNPSIRGETIPYLQVNRNVVQSIRDPEVLAVWVYLLSLPTDWEVIKNHVQNHFKIGERKLKSIFSTLRQHQLIDYTQSRDSDGKLGKHEIIVLNGSRFTELSTKNTGGAETARAVNRTCGNDDLHIKQNTNKIDNIKSFCENDPKKLKTTNNSSVIEPSFPVKKDWKEINQKKPGWAEHTKAPLADVSRQSNSYDANKMHKSSKGSSLLEDYMKKELEIVTKSHNETNKPLTRAEVSAEIPSKCEPGSQGAAIDANRCEDKPSAIRSPERLLETRSARSYLEALGLANSEEGNFSGLACT